MQISKELHDKLAKLATSMYEEDCRKEFPNPNPMYVEVGPKRLTLQEQIQRCLMTELSREAYDQGMETFEEAMDFDVPDEDPEPTSGFEYEEMVEEVPQDPGEPVATPPEVAEVPPAPGEPVPPVAPGPEEPGS